MFLHKIIAFRCYLKWFSRLRDAYSAVIFILCSIDIFKHEAPLGFTVV